MTLRLAISAILVAGTVLTGRAQATVAYVKPERHGSQQGMLVSGKRIFQLAHGGTCTVFVRDGGDTLHTEDTFRLGSASPANHCNQACWGVDTVPGASLPVAYVSVAKPKSPLDMFCHVESFAQDSTGRWSAQLVQTLQLDTLGWRDRGLDCIFGAPSWLIDAPRKSLWVLSGRKRTVAAITRSFDDNRLVATRFRIPSLSEGPSVTLGADDILGQVAFEMDAYATQSGCMADGRIYYAFGFGDSHPGSETKIRVYDVTSASPVAGCDLRGIVPEEPEALAIDGNTLLLNTNSAKIYSLPIAKTNQEIPQ